MANGFDSCLAFHHFPKPSEDDVVRKGNIGSCCPDLDVGMKVGETWFAAQPEAPAIRELLLNEACMGSQLSCQMGNVGVKTTSMKPLK